jgi:hypothetical protein
LEIRQTDTECENDSFRLKILSLTDELFFIEKHEPSYRALFLALPFLLFPALLIFLCDEVIGAIDYIIALKGALTQSPNYRRRKVE